MPCNNKSWELLLHIHCLLIWVRMCSGEKWEEKGFTWDCLPLFRHSAWTETPAQTHKGRSCFVLCLAHHKCWAVRVALAMLVLLPLQPPLPQPYCRCTWPWKGHGRTCREWFALSCLGGCSDILRFSEDPRYNLYCRCCVCVQDRCNRQENGTTRNWNSSVDLWLFTKTETLLFKARITQEGRPVFMFRTCLL